MKATAISKEISFNEAGDKEIVNRFTQCNFDQTEVFSWTIINDDNEEPDYIVLITKNGVSMEVAYEENTISDLAAEFRKRGVL